MMEVVWVTVTMVVMEVGLSMEAIMTAGAGEMVARTATMEVVAMALVVMAVREMIISGRWR